MCIQQGGPGIQPCAIHRHFMPNKAILSWWIRRREPVQKKRVQQHPSRRDPSTNGDGIIGTAGCLATTFSSHTSKEPKIATSDILLPLQLLGFSLYFFTNHSEIPVFRA